MWSALSPYQPPDPAVAGPETSEGPPDSGSSRQVHWGQGWSGISKIFSTHQHHQHQHPMTSADQPCLSPRSTMQWSRSWLPALRKTSLGPAITATVSFMQCCMCRFLSFVKGWGGQIINFRKNIHNRLHNTPVPSHGDWWLPGSLARYWPDTRRHRCPPWPASLSSTPRYRTLGRNGSKNVTLV